MIRLEEANSLWSHACEVLMELHREAAAGTSIGQLTQSSAGVGRSPLGVTLGYIVAWRVTELAAANDDRRLVGQLIARAILPTCRVYDAGINSGRLRDLIVAFAAHDLNARLEADEETVVALAAALTAGYSLTGPIRDNFKSEAVLRSYFGGR